MKCELCKKELDAYRDGRLTGGTKVLVDTHLAECKECAAVYMADYFTNKVIEGEKAIDSNPFLATRIMANIEKIEQERAGIESIPAYKRVLKPILIGTSIATAVMIGVITGNAYTPNASSAGIPQELAYIDDAKIEGISILTTE